MIFYCTEISQAFSCSVWHVITISFDIFQKCWELDTFSGLSWVVCMPVTRKRANSFFLSSSLWTKNFTVVMSKVKTGHGYWNSPRLWENEQHWRKLDGKSLNGQFWLTCWLLCFQCLPNSLLCLAFMLKTWLLFFHHPDRNQWDFLSFEKLKEESKGAKEAGVR